MLSALCALLCYMRAICANKDDRRQARIGFAADTLNTL